MSKRMKIFCGIVDGGRDAIIAMNIDDTESISDLQECIKEREEIRFPSHQLKLYLAKTRDGGWLPSRDPDVVQIFLGDASAKQAYLTCTWSRLCS